MFEIASIPILQIDIQKIDLKDKLYQISIQKNFRLLCQSIQQMGVMHPPVLQDKGAKYRVISGFQRILACKEIGMEMVSGRVVPSDISEHECARWAVADNASQRSLAPLEQSRSLTLIEKTLPKHMTIHAMAQQLGLPTTTRAIHQIRPLCHMAHYIQKGIANEYIAIPIAHILTQLSENDALSFSQLFEQLSAGINIQRELLTRCDEIAKRDKQSVTDILESEPVKSILDRYADDRRQRIHYIREHLKTRRYPNYTAMEQKVKSNIKDLKLNQQTRLEHPQYFESDTWHLQINFKNIRELKHSLADVLSRTDAINQIIEQDIH